MLFVINTSNMQGDVQEFPIWLDKLEDGLDLVSKLARKGHTLLKVYVIDQDSKTSLPVELFDGTFFGAPFQQLEQQWRAVLEKPLSPTAVSSGRVSDFFRLRLKTYDRQLSELEHKLTDLRGRLDKVVDARISPILKPNLIQHYQLILTTYEKHHSRLLHMREHATTILGQLR